MSPGPTTPTARALYLALRARYGVDAEAPGGIMVDEVSQNGLFGQGSRADAMYVGFTEKSGHRLEGFEIKVSRPDWLHELRDHEKGAPWIGNCHRWWIVAPPGIVEVSELPDAWGLLVWTGRGLRVDHPATTQDLCPSWPVVRSVMARYQTLARTQAEKRWGHRVYEAEQKAREAQQGTPRLAFEIPPEIARKARVFDAIETALGQKIDDDHWWRGPLTPEDVAQIARGLPGVRALRAEARRALKAVEREAKSLLESTIPVRQTLEAEGFYTDERKTS